MSVAIKVEGLTFTYRDADEPALLDVRLSVMDGQFIALMGHSGAGKSSLCMCLNALIPRFLKGKIEGRILVKGRDVCGSSVKEMAEIVGLVPQDFESQLVSTGIEQELAFGPANYGVPREELRRRVDKYLAQVGLERLKHREQSSLSGGQKQLLALASVLTLETPVLVLDEPASDLDADSRHSVIKIASEVAREGRSVLIVEREPDAVLGADEIVFMKAGRVVARGRPQQLLCQLPLMHECSIRPPQLVQLFQQLRLPEAPLTVDEAVALLRKTKCVVGRRPESIPQNVPHRTVLETRRVSYSYSDSKVEALRRLDLRIGEGEFVAILGPNGSGKTTLGKVLSGLLNPTEGEVLAAGKAAETLDRKALARLVGFVFQNPDSQIFASTVLEEVSFGPRNFGLSADRIKTRVTDCLQAVGLQGYEKRDPFTLTKGERQRVAVASVLALRPRVLILDEPTTGLDYDQQQSMMMLLKRINDAGHSIIFITHNTWLAAEYAARTIVMRDGKLLLDGPTRDVFSNQEILIAASLDTPPVVQLSNRLEARALTVTEMARVLIIG